MEELQATVAGLRTGTIPSTFDLLAVYGELTNCYYELAKETSARFSAKEQAVIKRRLSHAKQYRRLRGQEIKKAAVDANHEALLAIGEEYDKEIESEAVYTNLMSFKAAIDRSLEFCRTSISLIKKSETHA